MAINNCLLADNNPSLYFKEVFYGNKVKKKSSTLDRELISL